MNKKYIIFLFAFLLILAEVSYVNANLMISPFRVIFEGRTRSDVVYVINRSDETKTYRIEWFETFADENGKYIFRDKMTPEQEAALKPAQNLIRYSPRQVILGPGQKQAVRIAYRKPSGLEEGEYRSHVIFKQLAGTSEVGDIRQNKDTAAMQLLLNMSVSIPIVIRHGDLKADANFISGNLESNYGPDNEDVFNMVLKRKGEASTYGSIRIYDANDERRENILAVVNNIYVFPEQDTRKARIPAKFKIPSSINRFVAVYTGRDEYENKVFDEFTFER
ncbi:MAG: hypothetical protein CMP22_01310 [Rickettsiales bacterium]|nr:hypothetical protein [Rickettsiales bacterium]